MGQDQVTLIITAAENQQRLPITLHHNRLLTDCRLNRLRKAIDIYCTYYMRGKNKRIIFVTI